MNFKSNSRFFVVNLESALSENFTYWRCVFDNKELLVFYVDSPGARQSRIVLEPVDGWDGEALDLALEPDC